MCKKGILIQFLATFLGTLNIISSGLHYGWSSPSIPKLMSNTSTIILTEKEASTVVIIIEAGTLSGCLLVGSIINRIGRKSAVLISSIPAFTAWILIAFASTMAELSIARYLGGVTDGMIFCAMNMYISEISDPRFRGLLGTSLGFSYGVGHLLINVIGSHFSIKTTALSCSILPVLLVLTFCWMPESPYYLVTRKQNEDAKGVLKVLHGSDKYQENFDRIIQGITTQRANRGRCWDLVSIYENRKTLMIMTVLFAIQQGSGETPLLFYTQTIFEGVKSIISPENCTVIYLSTALLAVIFSSIIIDRVGRKPLLVASMGGSGIALLSLAVFCFVQNRTNIDVTAFSFVPIISLTVHIFMYGIGLQTIPISIAAELFSTDVKAYGVSTCDIFVSLFGTIASKYFQDTYDVVGLELPFLTFASCCFLGIIFVIFFILETKNKTLEEIQLQL